MIIGKHLPNQPCGGFLGFHELKLMRGHKILERIHHREDVTSYMSSYDL